MVFLPDKVYGALLYYIFSWLLKEEGYMKEDMEGGGRGGKEGYKKEDMEGGR